MKNKFISALLILFAISAYIKPLIAQTKENSDTLNNKAQERYFEIRKNIDVFNSVLRELDLFYVDTLNLNKTVRTGIDNMLNSLDPYTEYFNEEDMVEFNFMTTGEYAGIGATIVYKDNRIVINQPYENKPAAKAGLKAGDVILSIDGKDMTKCAAKDGENYGRTLSNYVSSALKGQPNTTIEVEVERIGEKKPLKFKVTREKIVMNPVAYSGIVSPGIGYINLSSFTDKSAADVKNAFQTLKKQGIKSLVLDLRQNGGGVLEDAIQIVNMFIPKGTVVLTTKGKLKQWDRTYRTTIEPMDVDIPIAVLVDRGSASASEIVAGSLQDLDRAVLIGEKTYGKGLVQTTRQIPYDGSLKVTTSKYYIPSGRCIQAIDYSHRNPDGSVGRIPDSLTTVFKTQLGRPVRDGGGVSPDIKLDEDKMATILYYLENQMIIFDWVNNWVATHKSIVAPNEFCISENDYNNFKEFVKSKNFKYDRLSAKSMESLKEVMEFEGYMKSASDEFKALEAKLVPDLDRDLETFKNEITKRINTEIIKRYYFQNGEFIYTLKTDKGLAKAIEILNNKEEYKKILSPSSSEMVENKDSATDSKN